MGFIGYGVLDGTLLTGRVRWVTISAGSLTVDLTWYPVSGIRHSRSTYSSGLLVTT